jgi:hypothetical protein
MLSDIGYSNFKRLIVFCTKKEEKGRSLHGTNSDNDDLLGHATIVSITRDGRLAAKCGGPARWHIPTLDLHCLRIFLT